MRPKREHATANRQTYFITSRTAESRPFFKHERWAKLFIDTLYHYRDQGAYQLHAFVLMPDHFHAIITPAQALERAVQFIKGGFSYRAKKELEYPHEVWQKGFSDHRIRDEADYYKHAQYIHENPVRAGFCRRPEDCPYSSARPGYDLDPMPQRLKPELSGEADGAPEGAPFQSLHNKKAAGGNT